jgi:hypothetical protein
VCDTSILVSHISELGGIVITEDGAGEDLQLLAVLVICGHLLELLLLQDFSGLGLCLGGCICTRVVSLALPATLGHPAARSRRSGEQRLR